MPGKKDLPHTSDSVLGFAKENALRFEMLRQLTYLDGICPCRSVILHCLTGLAQCNIQKKTHVRTGWR